ncbi:hypothetical protein SETIT_2G202700v2 [Setaria italica]|uniref:Uncharacterized protein n=1 Tax=Setaria italica TaxID=4555 RepID=A0A368Q0T0_SETIT|nr:hypothetical protein SETIT_2G202700v2 [Setaria italica]
MNFFCVFRLTHFVPPVLYKLLLYSSTASMCLAFYIFNSAWIGIILQHSLMYNSPNPNSLCYIYLGSDTVLVNYFYGEFVAVNMVSPHCNLICLISESILRHCFIDYAWQFYISSYSPSRSSLCYKQYMFKHLYKFRLN